MGKYNSAVSLLKAAAKIKQDFLVYSKLGDAYTALKNYQMAIISYKKSIDYSSTFGWSYYDLANVYIKIEDYDSAKLYLNEVLSLKLPNYEFMYERIYETLNEIDKRLLDKEYENVSQIIDNIKEYLHTDTYNITHYTSLTVAQNLILKNSELRLSEATFLNDTSEGRTLLNYLQIFKGDNSSNRMSYEFINKPYIGSFVKPELYNDLSLWRMYGKEEKEEAEGCSLLIDGTKFIEEFRKSLKEGKEEWNDVINKEFKFYKVAYLGNNICSFGDAKNDKKLSDLLLRLKNSIMQID